MKLEKMEKLLDLLEKINDRYELDCEEEIADFRELIDAISDIKE